MIETGIEKAIKNYIFIQGGWITKVQSGMLMQNYKGRTHAIHLADRGTPDMVGCLNGRFLGIEVKKDKKAIERWLAYPLGLRGKPVKEDKRIEAQQRIGKQIRESGGFFAIVCSVDELVDDLKSAGII